MMLPTSGSHYLQIGSTRIGPDDPTYIIAEAGVNHNGSIENAMAMVSAATAAGANAVKFQAFSAERLVTRQAASAAYQKAQSQYDLLKPLELSQADFALLALQCRSAGIEMLATPFGPPDVEMLMELGVRAIKIASPDVTNYPLLRSAAQTRLPVILSTGASALDEVALAMETLILAGAQQIALLHCVSQYPTPLDQVNLLCIRSLAERFCVPVGFSDHTVEESAGELAVLSGACILEKHFTLDRRLPGPDQAMSLTGEELARYVARARAVRRGGLDLNGLSPQQRTALGDGVKVPQAGEQDVRRVARSSVTAAVDISAGGVISRSMLTVKRPGGGVAPGEIDSLPGRVAKVRIPADTTITRDMIA